MKEQIKTIPEVDNISINDFGIIKKADIKFSNELNIIIGKNATGKTTVINYLLKMSEPDNMSEGNRRMFEILEQINKSCLIMDDSLNCFNDKNTLKILKHLENLKRQVILTLNNSSLKYVKKNIKANIINTKNFQLKKEIE